MSKVKYIRTKSDEIIVFSEYLQHSRFKWFNPISAGFISISANGKSDPTIQCYGTSISLRLDSKPEEDSELARKQILGFGFF